MLSIRIGRPLPFWLAGLCTAWLLQACVHPPVDPPPPLPEVPKPVHEVFIGPPASAFHTIQVDVGGTLWLAGQLTHAGTQQPWLVAMDTGGLVLQTYTGNCSGTSAYHVLHMDQGFPQAAFGYNQDAFGMFGIGTALQPGPDGCDELVTRINSDWRIFDYLQTSSGLHYFTGDITTLNVRSLLVMVSDSLRGSYTMKVYGGSFIDSGVRLLETANGEVWILGHTENRGAGGRDLWFLRVDANGDTVHTFTVGGAGYEQAGGFVELQGGDFLVASHSASVDPLHNSYVARVATSGAVQWDLHLGGSRHEGAEDIIDLGGGQYLVLANTESHGTESNVTLLKISDSGTLIDTALVTTGSFDTGLRLARYGGHFWVCGHLMEAGITRAFVYRVKEF